MLEPIHLLAVLVTYVLSSLSFPWLVAGRYGVDLRTTGSRKLGGSNLVKTVGVLPGIAGGLLDAAKGFAAVLVARALGLPLDVQLACGLAANVGKMCRSFTASTAAARTRLAGGSRSRQIRSRP